MLTSTNTTILKCGSDVHDGWSSSYLRKLYQLHFFTKWHKIVGNYHDIMTAITIKQSEDHHNMTTIEWNVFFHFFDSGCWFGTTNRRKRTDQSDALWEPILPQGMCGEQHSLFWTEALCLLYSASFPMQRPSPFFLGWHSKYLSYSIYEAGYHKIKGRWQDVVAKRYLTNCKLYLPF